MKRSNSGPSPFHGDPELLVAFRRGERLDVVYRHYVGSLKGYFRVLARRAGARELAEESVTQDLAQEAFLRVFSARSREAYDGVRDFGPYLRTIARNCFVDLLRRRRAERQLPPETSAVLDDATGARSEPDERLALLVDYLANVAPPLKRVYEHRYVLGLSQESTSRALGLSRRSLRTLETRLCGDFRKVLLRRELLAASSRRALFKQ